VETYFDIKIPSSGQLDDTMRQLCAWNKIKINTEFKIKLNGAIYMVNWPIHYTELLQSSVQYSIYLLCVLKLLDQFYKTFWLTAWGYFIGDCAKLVQVRNNFLVLEDGVAQSRVYL
jgi:hypothetical protein